ncbi:MAG: cytochrome c3 family protein [Deltaproteobacteria bacterium]|nr:cytochrome c3 family protein [Deltaproteobacteria bacterium]
MKKVFKRLIPILFLLMLSGIIVYSFTNNPPHQFKESQCGFCHLNYDYPLRFSNNITTLCNYCHGKKRNTLSHIVGIKPSMQTPADFHLDENGEMTCVTCHNIHMDSVDSVTGERSYLLWSNLRGREFCDACHGNTIAVVNSPVHSDVIETAHFGYYTGGVSSIDRVSIQCLGCHEGSTASHVSVTTKKGSPIVGSHPIGRDYMKAYKKDNTLRSPRSLSLEIKFFEGRVGCTSCHNPFSLAKHQLSITNEESKLCFECHLK